MIRLAIESHFEKELQLRLRSGDGTLVRRRSSPDAVLYRERRELPPGRGEVRRRFAEEYAS